VAGELIYVGEGAKGGTEKHGEASRQLRDFAKTEYEGGPKNNWNLNVARELKVVARCTARYRVSTQYSSSLPRGVSLGWVLLLLWLFF
jgi:hypothetical protein